jgi:hypothetical protein
MWMVTAEACAASFGLLTLHADLGLANYMTNPAVHLGTAMHDTDKSLPGDHGSVVPPPAQVSTERAPAETAPEPSAGPVEPELTRRQLLQLRMPPRTGIKAIIDRRRSQPDPWLDDKYDWQPEG